MFLKTNEVVGILLTNTETSVYIKERNTYIINGNLHKVNYQEFFSQAHLAL